MLIPRIFIGLLIDDREQAAKEVRNEVFSSWRGGQTINGPVLFIPAKGAEYKKDTMIEQPNQHTDGIYLVPEEYDFSAKLASETLHRGIYDVVVYKTAADIKGGFELPEDLRDVDWSGYDPADSKIYVDFGNVSNPNLSDKINITIGDTTCVMKYSPNLVAMFCSYDATQFVKESRKLDFSTSISLKGSSSFSVMPVGNVSEIHIESDYPSPSFKGYYSPDSRKVDAGGFTADWKVLRNIPLDYWSEPDKLTYISAMDGTEEIYGIRVEMNVPVDQYTQNSRAIKYSFLIVVLTFITVFVVEYRKRTPIHWVQYLLIGFAIMVFYTLLLSFSEYMAFGWAYLIASAMTIGLITAYMAGILKVNKTAYLVGGILSLLYAFIYLLLTLETLSLLVGSVGLFVILALIMFASRKINWQGNDK